MTCVSAIGERGRDKNTCSWYSSMKVLPRVSVFKFSPQWSWSPGKLWYFCLQIELVASVCLLVEPVLLSTYTISLMNLRLFHSLLAISWVLLSLHTLFYLASMWHVCACVRVCGCISRCVYSCCITPRVWRSKVEARLLP